MEDLVELVATELLNARAARRGKDPVPDVLMFVSADIADCARDDARRVVGCLVGSGLFGLPSAEGRPPATPCGSPEVVA